MILVWLILFGAVATGAYIRLAPSDPARWHVDPRAAADPGLAGVLLRHPLPGQDRLSRFDTAIKTEPRLSVLAGSLAEGRVTYIARSRWLGFPDYITVSNGAGDDAADETGDEAADDAGGLAILSRLRFGRYDFGVNRARLERVLQRL